MLNNFITKKLEKSQIVYKFVANKKIYLCYYRET